VRRGNAASKGATVVFWRLEGGDKDELLALRVLLLDFDVMFLWLRIDFVVLGVLEIS